MVFGKWPPWELKNSTCLNSNRTSIYFKPYILNSRDKFFLWKCSKYLKSILSTGTVRRLLIFRCMENSRPRSNFPTYVQDRSCIVSKNLLANCFRNCRKRNDWAENYRGFNKIFSRRFLMIEFYGILLLS